VTRSPLRYFASSSLQDLVRELPVRALIPLALAIFSLFAVLGPVTDVLAGGAQPPWVVVRNSLFAGTLALGYAFGSMRRHWGIFGATLVVQFVWVALGRRGFLGHYDPLPPERVREQLTFDGLVILVVMAASYSCFLWFINGTAARYLRVRAEMELARQIHQVLVPAITRRIGEFEFSGFSAPSGEVGGDLVDVVTRDGTWFGYVADVSGHGVSSGVVMGMFKSAIRMRLIQGGAISSLLDDLNTVLFPLKSGATYVTAACVRGPAFADAAAGTQDAGGALEFAVAGHLPILRVRAGGVDEITTPQIPIGMFEDFRFTSSTLACERGDVLALITDGLTEVFDSRDREFGMDAVKQLLAASAALPLAEIADRIVAAARAHGAQFDDQTLLLIRRV
jgi:hypothetical protein